MKKKILILGSEGQVGLPLKSYLKSKNYDVMGFDIVEKNNQALILLPEIFLTNDFKSRFEDFFGFEPAIWHSKISPKKCLEMPKKELLQ